ncbi:MAG: transglycosylase SLT domain-containing protein [Acetobacteraceae bacterium]|nr:transglycosylase SLT domain-containing protein [Acetobacteraceae bacterium]
MRWLPLLAVLASAPAFADQQQTPFGECDSAITAAAKLSTRMPDKLLPAIGRVESGRLDSMTGKVRPWPWTINVEGTGYFYGSKAEVISAVQAFEARGVRSIDVGCMQVNLMHHPKAFSSLEEAFDPSSNARYAVKFLTALYGQTKDWNLATAWYHSMSPDRGEEYQRLVFGRVMTPMGGASTIAAARVRGPYGAWPSEGERYAAMPPITLQFGAFAPAKATAASFAGVPVTSVPTLAPLAPALPIVGLPARR